LRRWLSEPGPGMIDRWPIVCCGNPQLSSGSIRGMCPLGPLGSIKKHGARLPAVPCRHNDTDFAFSLSPALVGLLAVSLQSRASAPGAPDVSGKLTLACATSCLGLTTATLPMGRSATSSWRDARFRAAAGHDVATSALEARDSTTAPQDEGNCRMNPTTA